MKTVYLEPSVTRQNCSRINWCYPSERFSNDIQKLISRYDVTKISCSKHNYMFNVLPSYSHSAEPFSFDETNMLMQLMPNESESFYLKAAIREYVNTFEVYNAEGERVYPEDIA